eukprot:TRINITY_DN98_c0_g4_i4.p1 TRINITY_DN98_c0_g4~~TRINITY_DN98_c0_g4_i4.p1  ORF type:complete len:696 (-),score=261.60 TRINITY_DN98_c0_g4_i4:180-2267(-)
MSDLNLVKAIVLAVAILTLLPPAGAVNRGDVMGKNVLQHSGQKNFVLLAEQYTRLRRISQNPPETPPANTTENATATDPAAAQPPAEGAPAEGAPEGANTTEANATEGANAPEGANATETTDAPEVENPRERFARILAAVRQQLALGLSLKHTAIERFTSKIFEKQDNLNNERRHLADLQAECVTHFNQIQSLQRRLDHENSTTESRINDSEVLSARVESFYSERCEGTFLFLNRLKDIKRATRLLENIQEWLTGQSANGQSIESLLYIGQKQQAIKSMITQLIIVAKKSKNQKLLALGEQLVQLTSGAAPNPEELVKQLIGLVEKLNEELKEELSELIDTELETFTNFEDFVALATAEVDDKVEEIEGIEGTLNDLGERLKDEEAEYGICLVRAEHLNLTVVNISSEIHGLTLERRKAVRKIEGVLNALDAVYTFWVEKSHEKLEEAEQNETAPAEGTPADPNAAPADPNAAPADPNAAPADPNAAPANPPAEGAPAADAANATAAADPNAAPANPPADGAPANPPAEGAPPADAANATAAADPNAAPANPPADGAPANPPAEGAPADAANATAAADPNAAPAEGAPAEGTPAEGAPAGEEEEGRPIDEEIVKFATDESKTTDEIVAFLEGVFNEKQEGENSEQVEAANGPEAKSLGGAEEKPAENPAGSEPAPANATAPAAAALLERTNTLPQ